MIYLIFIAAILGNAFANIFIKIGLKKGGAIDFGHFWESLTGLAGNFFFLVGVFLFAVALFCYGYVLQKTNLSVAYPIMTSVGFVVVVLVSVFYLKESLTPWQVLGILMIGGGVWLVAAK